MKQFVIVYLQFQVHQCQKQLFSTLQLSSHLVRRKTWLENIYSSSVGASIKQGYLQENLRPLNSRFYTCTRLEQEFHWRVLILRKNTQQNVPVCECNCLIHVLNLGVELDRYCLSSKHLEMCAHFYLPILLTLSGARAPTEEDFWPAHLFANSKALWAL